MESRNKFEKSIFEKLHTNSCISQERFDEIKQINENNDDQERRKKLGKELLALLKISSKRALQMTNEHFSNADLIKKLLGAKEEREYGMNIYY